MKLNHCFTVPALAASLLLGGVGLAQADGEKTTKSKEIASFGTLRTATPEAARAQAEEWLKGVGKTDDATQKAFAALWAADHTLIDKVTETICLGSPEAKKLLDEARDPKGAAPTEVPALGQGQEAVAVLPRQPGPGLRQGAVQPPRLRGGAGHAGRREARAGRGPGHAACSTRPSPSTR